MIIKICPTQIRPEYVDYKKNYYSQNGEDGLIEFFLRKMGISKGYFVEFGAWDGFHLSNCANLAKNGWAGCFIEGDSIRFKELQNNYTDVDNIAVVNSFVEKIGDFSLDSILDSINAPRTIDVLSIDIDGDEYGVWNSFCNHDVNLVVVEFNPTIPANLIVIQEPEDGLNFSSSLAAFWELAENKGYKLVAATDWNAFFITQNACDVFSIPFYKPWELKDTSCETFFFQGQNGQIRIAGNKSLLWHGVKINEDNLQHLPKELREIPTGQSPEYFEKLQQYKMKHSNIENL